MPIKMLDRIDTSAAKKAVAYSLAAAPLMFLTQFLINRFTIYTYVPHPDALLVMIPSLAFVLYMAETQ